MKGVIKHIKIVIDDISKKGIFLAFANALWFVRKLLPQWLFLSIISKKHCVVKKKISEIIGDIKDLQVPPIRQLNKFNESPIWFCWLQGKQNMPPLVQTCLKSIQANNGEHPVVFVNLDNYGQYITIPTHIVELFKNGKIQYAHFADIIRTALLYNYGGCWMDSTIFLTDRLREEIFNNEFYSVKLERDKFFVSKERWSNFFLSCSSGNLLMGRVLKMFDIYLLKKDFFIDYFMMDYFMDMNIETDIQLKLMIDSIPYNNKNIHQLKFHLNDDYSKAKFDNICKDTYIHKLSWKMVPLNPSCNSIYNYIKFLY